MERLVSVRESQARDRARKAELKLLGYKPIKIKFRQPNKREAAEFHNAFGEAIVND